MVATHSEDKTKTRVFFGNRHPYYLKTFATFQSNGTERPAETVQVTVSRYLPWEYLNLGRNKWDTGSPFETTKVELWCDETEHHGRFGNYGASGWQYDSKTRMVPTQTLQKFWSTDLSTDQKRKDFVSGFGVLGHSESELNALGTLAIGITKPTNPAADMITTMAELLSERKFFSIPGKSGSLSGEYLNYSFGIAPVISTAEDLRKAIDNADKIVRQFRRDSGRWVRRKFNFDPIVSSSRTTATGVYPWAHSGTNVYLVEAGTLTTIQRTETRSWFSGAFVYHLPKETIPKRTAELDRLYGVKPSVSTGWELLPYSWLVDYFVPVGHLLSYSADYFKYGLILPYAYLMSHTIETTEYQWKGRIRDASGNWQHRTVSATLIRERKKRVRASPYGFGVLPDGLNVKQWSILAALGISRASGGRF